MSDPTNAEYFAGRAAAERAMSAAATDPRAAAIHADLAERYDELAIEFSAATVAPFPGRAEEQQASAS
ncbi:MAG TPA: hypothetical protein VFS45_04190 [Sphingomicrobium sp.]|nr:hypothetical protein [Sphingomicrobium sp.]